VGARATRGRAGRAARGAAGVVREADDEGAGILHSTRGRGRRGSRTGQLESELNERLRPPPPHPTPSIQPHLQDVHAVLAIQGITEALRPLKGSTKSRGSHATLDAAWGRQASSS